MVELIQEEKTIMCCSCEKHFTEDNIIHAENETYCQDCFDESFNVCELCGRIEDINESHSTNHDGVICNRCYERNYITCNNCGTELSISNDSIWDAFEDSYCRSCFEDMFYTCDSCGDTIHQEDSYTNDNGIYCSDCFPSNELLKSSWSTFLKREYFNPTNNLKVFGVEIETNVNDYESLNTDSEYLKHFQIVEDGSLSEEGKEFVTCPLPCNKEGYKVLKDFTENIGKKFLSIDRRCGLHIHLYLDNEFINLKNLQKIIKIYMKLEGILFSMNPKSRRDNNYCKTINPCIDYASGSMRNKLFEKLLSCESFNDFLSMYYDRPIKNKDCVPKDKYHQNRYYWINLNSIFYRNTLEIRIHSGTVDSKKIINWIEINKCILEYALRNSLEQIDIFTDKELLHIILNDKLEEYVYSRIRKFNPTVKEGKIINPEEDF